MAFRNISIVLTANVGRYTQSVDKATQATRALSEAASRIGSTSREAVAGMQKVAQSATQNRESLHQMKRAMGIAMAQHTHTSAAMRMGDRALKAFGITVNETSGFLGTMAKFLLSSVSAIASFSIIHTVISVARRAWQSMREAVVGFDQAMVESLAIMSDADRRMRGALIQTALEVSRQWGIAAEEAARALFYLASAGLSATESMRALPIVGAFARAGMMDMAKATDLLVDTQSALGRQVNSTGQQMADMKNIADLLTQANLASNATVEQFAEALQNKGAAAARQANQSLETTLAVLEAFAMQGIKSRVAGERLNQVLRDMQTQAIKNRGAWERFGVAVFDASGNMRPLPQIIRDMEAQMAGMSSEQRRATFMMLGFQDRSVAATQALLGLGAVMQDFEEENRAVSRETEGTGKAADVARKNMQSLTMQFARMRTTVLASVINGFNSVRRGIERLHERAGPAIENIAQVVSKLAAAIGPMVGLFAKIAGAAVWAVLVTAIEIVERLAAVADRFSGVLSALAILALARFTQALFAASLQTGILSRGVALLVGSFIRLPMLVQAVTLAFRGQTLAAQTAAASTSVYQASTLRLATGLRGVAGQIKTFATTFPSLGAIGGAALMGVTAAAGLLAAGIAWANREADKMIANLLKGLDLSTGVGRAEAFGRLNTQMGEIEERQTRMMQRGRNKGWLHPSVITEALRLRSESNKTADAIEENSKRTERANNMLTTVWQKTGRSMARSEVREIAEDLGINLDELSTKDKDFKRLTAEINRMALGFQNSGLAAQEWGQMTTEEQKEVVDHTEKAAERFEKFFQGMIDPAKAYTKVLDDTIERTKALVSLGDVWSTVTDRQREAVEKQKDAQLKAVDDEIEAIQERQRQGKRAIDDEKRVTTRAEQDRNARRTRGQKASKTASRVAQDDAREETESLEDEARRRIDVLEDQKKAIQEAAEVKPVVTFEAYTRGLADLVKEEEKARRDLDTIAAAGATGLAKALREQGRDAFPLVAEVAAQIRRGGPEIARAVAEANAHVLKLGDLDPTQVRVSLDELTAQVTKQADTMQTRIAQVMQIAAAVEARALEDPALRARLDAAGLHTTKQIAQALAELPAEAQGTFDEMVSHLGKAGQRGVENLIVALGNSQGKLNERITELFTEGMDVALAVVQGKSPLIQQALLNAVPEALQATVEQTLKAMGFDISKLDEQVRQRERELHIGARTVPGRVAMQARGGITFFQGGGLANRQDVLGALRPSTTSESMRRVAQMARPGEWRVWAEPETGGEAYIPLAKEKRGRSVAVLNRVAEMFGYSLEQAQSRAGRAGPVPYAFGGIVPGQQVSGARPTANQPQVVYVEKPGMRSQTTEYNFHGPIQGVRMEDAVEFADRKKRQRALVNR